MTSLENVDNLFVAAQKTALNHQGLQKIERDLRNAISSCDELRLEDRQRLGAGALQYLAKFPPNTLPPPIKSIRGLMQELNIHTK